MVDYIIQVLLFQVVFLTIYDFILKRETFFQWNRAYLIFTSLFAYIIPLLKFEKAQEIVPQEYVVMLPEVILSPSTYVEKQLDVSTLLFDGLHWIFFIGITISSILFIYKIVQLFALIYQNKKEVNPDYNLILLQEKKIAFSFFNYIFIGKTVQKKDQIITHELVHVKQKHSVDLLVFEIQKIVFWFNPFSYIYQNRISEVHEFIADSKSVSKENKSTYFQGLLAEIFQVEKFAFINSFHKQSFIKKRIIMINKKNSKEILKFKYLLLIPILMGMMIYTSCKTVKPEVQKELTINEAIIELMEKRVKEKRGTLEELKYVKNALSSRLVNIEQDQRMFEKPGNLERALEILLDGMIKERGYLNKKIDTKDYTNADNVPFAIVSQVPVFTGCEGTNVEKKRCFMESVQKHVRENFNTSIGENLGLEKGKKKVYVQFTIDKTGSIVNIKARGIHKDLETEAKRVIASLPQMQPGEHNGKKVGVKYTLPISLSGSENNYENIDSANKDYTNADVVPFSHIDQVPVFPGCENADNQKECFIQNVTIHVNTNFNTSVGKNLGLGEGNENLGLEKGKEKIYVQFKIDKKGNIVNIRSRAAHKDLETEAIRVISDLPQMQPGEHNGRKVGVKYTLPITLNID